MPEEKIPNPYPTATAGEFDAAPGTREQKAARCIAARRFAGIPTRGFLLGGNDHSPVMQGLLDFTTEVYALIDEIAASDLPFDEAQSGKLVTQADKVLAMMQDHKCDRGDPGVADAQI